MDKIKCPKCSHEFELTEAVAGPLIAKARADAELSSAAAIEAARKTIEAEALAKAKNYAAAELSVAKQTAKESQDREQAMSASLAIAQNEQAKALKLQRELEDSKRELELTIEKRTAQSLAAVKAAAELAAEERLGVKLAEKEETIASMARTVDDLRRKAEQGSMQTQGEAQEVALEAALKSKYPMDSIEPVAKGVQGGDCLQVVMAGSSEQGRILWESKQTKNWSDAWLTKLRDDGRTAKADLLVIVTAALPKGVEAFDLVDGVWVCLPRYAISLAAALRQAIAEAATARAAGEGLETKAGLVYTYLTGPRFKSRVSAIVEAFTTMKEDLDSERRAIQKQWSKREAQIERVLQGTTGMYGDLQAIAGRSLVEIEGLDLLALPREAL